MIQTERQILAVALQNAEYAEILLENACLFYDVEHKRIYSIMTELYTDNVEINLPAVISRYEEKESQIPEHILTDLALPHMTYQFGYLYEQLRKREQKRQVKAIAQDMAQSTGDEFDAYVDELVNIRDSAGTDEIITPKQFTAGDVDDIFNKSYFIKTGIRALDEKIIGFFDEQLIILAARPGNGKTTLALQICMNINYPTLFVSGETGKKELYGKMISNRAKVETWKLDARKWSEDEYRRIVDAHKYWQENCKMSVYDGAFSINKIRGIIKRHAKKNRLTVVDYLQIIAGGKGQSEHLRISEITRSLKQLARDTKMPILLLSQLSREHERLNREPKLSDLRESGAIEADADTVIFLHDNDGWYPIVAKNRKGPVGQIKNLIHYDKPYFTIKDIDVMGHAQKSMDWIHN